MTTEALARIAGPVAGTGADATLYTVPASTTISIPRGGIHIVNNNAGSAAACKMSIGADGAGTRILPTGFSIAAKSEYNSEFLVILNAAEVLHWNGTSDLVVTISGVSITP